MKYNILLAGVGGQGLVLLSRILGEACMNSGLNVVTEEQHGLAQRSGSISAHIRIGDVHSPLIPYGSADIIISMEAMESLRNIEYLKPEGIIVTSSRILHPVNETNTITNSRRENLQYTTLEQVTKRLEKITKKITQIESGELALKAGNPRSENIVLLGAAAAQAGFPLNRSALEKAIEKNVPSRTIDVNIKAFNLGNAETLNQ
jgi:indolepyruvate ferredoxin oxidoreductase beta subunit